MKENMEMQDDILIVYLLGETSLPVTNKVKELRKSDADFNKRLTEFESLWNISKNLDDKNPIDAVAALSRFRKKSPYLKTANTHEVNTNRWTSWLAMAASLLLIAGCAWLYFSSYAIQHLSIVTKNSPQTTTLSDGSVITLNRESALEYPSRFQGNIRQVSLGHGEAFFNISHNKSKPFFVKAGAVLIKVVGTSFNVKNKKGTVELIVETGVVQVSAMGQVVKIYPGERILISGKVRILKKEVSHDRLYTYYRTKKFIADDTPLWRMVDVLNEAYDSHIVIGRAELKNLPLNTTFNEESLDKILDVISRTFKITVERKQGQILLK